MNLLLDWCCWELPGYLAAFAALHMLYRLSHGDLALHA